LKVLSDLFVQQTRLAQTLKLTVLTSIFPHSLHIQRSVK